MYHGKITSFDPVDGLGFIVLEDGREIRFTLTACGYMRPQVGKRVRVISLTEGYQGKLKATFIEDVSDT